MPRASMMFLIVAATAAAFVVRVVLVRLTRRRWPTVATAVERWWAWTPLGAVCVFAIALVPPIGIALTVGALIALARADAVGSPFRPRR